MKLKFKVEMEDIVALNLFHFENSPTIKKIQLLYTWGFSIFLFFLFGAIAIYHKTIGFFPLGLIVSILYFIYIRQSFKKRHEKLVKKMYGEGKNKGILGNHEMLLSETALITSSEVSKAETQYSAIEKVLTNDQFGFIYLSSVTAFVIPRSRVCEGDFKQFIDELNTRIAQCQTVA